MKKLVKEIRNVDVMNTKLPLLYYIANELADAGFSLKFNRLNVYLEESDIEIHGNITVEGLPNGDLIYTEYKEE